MRGWVTEGDASQSDAGTRILGPSEAGSFFVHPRNLPINFGGVTKWTAESTPGFITEDNLLLFRSMRGVVFVSKNGKLNYIMPLPWTP